MNAWLLDHAIDVLWLILSLVGFGGMGLVWAIQGQHTTDALERARKAERLADHRQKVLAAAEASNERLRSLLDREASQHAERLADLVSVVGTDTAEPAEARQS